MVGRGARALIEQGFAAAGEPLGAERRRRLCSTASSSSIAAASPMESRPFDGRGRRRWTGSPPPARRWRSAPTSAPTCRWPCWTPWPHRPLRRRGRRRPRRRAPKPDARHLLTAVDAAGGRIGARRSWSATAPATSAPPGPRARPVWWSVSATPRSPPAELGGDHLIDHFAELPALATRLLARPPERLPRRGRRAIRPPSFGGRVAQRESTSFTPRGSQVQSLSHPPILSRRYRTALAPAPECAQKQGRRTLAFASRPHGC